MTSPTPRRFGSPPSSSLSSTSNSSSPNLTSLLPPRSDHRRNSSASTSFLPLDSLESAADRSLAWLHTWAPKGEGRGREFLSSTLNGVATVAGAVGNQIGEMGHEGLQRAGLSRPSSFHVVPQSSQQSSSLQISNRPAPTLLPQSQAQLQSQPQITYSTSSAGSSPPGSSQNGIIQSGTMNGNQDVIPITSPPQIRKPPQPSNLSRLGISHTSRRNPTNPPPIPRSSSASATIQQHTGPHGPSHLNPHSTRPQSHSRSPSTGQVGVVSQGLSRSSSKATTEGGFPRRAGMPYKIGFQPAGVRNDRSEEYFEERRKWSEEMDKEEGRLGRRWAKLVDLHFNPNSYPDPTIPSLPRSPSLSSTSDKRRSLLSIDGALDALKPKEMWKGFKTAAGPPTGGEEARKRAAEQAIVKWEDDSQVHKCRICQSSFSLANRKHHCRVCGRIVCSLPPTPPALLAVQVQLFSPTPSTPPSPSRSISLPAGTRTEKCCLLLVADWKTGRGEEVDEGFVGWMKVGQGSEDDTKSPSMGKRASRTSIASGSDNSIRDIPLPQQPKEVQVKGVRVCKECWATVSRKQKMTDRQKVSGFARLYGILRSLQAEIESLMPDYEDSLAELSASPDFPDPSPDLLSSHKNLITLFTQYEHLSKRLSNLPCDEGSSQAVIQSAVARSSASFLSKEMLKVQALPKFQKRAAENKRKTMKVVQLDLSDLKVGDDVSSGRDEEEEVDVAGLLQPLLEQEAQLE
ncbi:hypothetical protein M231_01721 [Tremella mesenterica]|uniref:FYVE-type domain-containing protein n=1 Tax=Tremella mesenterica TaxID=5217 RepID=A0A4Q1BS81_TREME|nr:hypothetical protein M231_01721 [Tremella mesenterica]